MLSNPENLTAEELRECEEAEQQEINEMKSIARAMAERSMSNKIGVMTVDCEERVIP